jgi:hypothetical protein
MLKSIPKDDTYTEQVLRWKLTPPCSALFLDTSIPRAVEESAAAEAQVERRVRV